MPAALWMLLSVLFFSLMDLALKMLAPFYPAMEVTFLRGVASLPFVLLWVWRTSSLRGLRVVNWPLHLVRSALGVGLMGCFVLAVEVLPLSTAYAVYFVAPLLITVASAVLLGERVGRRRWLAVAVGLGGVLVVLRPSWDGVSVGALWALGAAVCYALMAVSVRRLTRTDSLQAIVVWFLLLMTVMTGALSVPQWVPVAVGHWGWVLGMGLAGTAGQVAVTFAFQKGEASSVAPLEYTGLVWAIFWDRVLWGTLLDGVALAGAAVIIGSGVFLLTDRQGKRTAAGGG